MNVRRFLISLAVVFGVALGTPLKVFAALSAATVLEVRTTGSATNGGGWVVGASGTDWSVQDAAQYSVTDGVTAGTTTITSATANFGTDVVGNIMYVQGGTGSVTAGWYQITARASATSITVDRSTGLTAGTGVTLKIGGGLDSPGLAAAIKVAATGAPGMDVFIKFGTYNLSGNTVNTAGCQVSDTTGGASATNPTFWVGYDTTRTLYNVDANRPTINANLQTSLTLFGSSADYQRIRNLIFDGNSKSSLTGFLQNGAYSKVDRVHAKNCTVYGLDLQAGNTVCSFWFCSATGGSGTAGIRTGAGSAATYWFCESYGNTVQGFVSGPSHLIGCISSGNTGATTDGFGQSSVGVNYMCCVAYGNGRSGFQGDSSIGCMTYLNCVAEANTGAGWSTGSVRGMLSMYNCGAYNNGGGSFTTANIPDILGFVNNTTGTFFVDAANGNFAPNTTANQGLALKAAGFPGVMPRGTTTGYSDIGFQHQDSGGGGGGLRQSTLSGGFSP